jgi:FlaA1/EpsC-like NDP-sugar epimerase
LRRWVARIGKLGRYQRRAILATGDYLVLTLALWALLSLRMGALYLPETLPLGLLFAGAPLVAIAANMRLRVYRRVTRSFGRRGGWLMLAAASASSAFLALATYLTGIVGVPRSVVLLYPFVGTLGLLGTRKAATALFEWAGVDPPKYLLEHANKRNVLIYGAGSSGAQLLQSLHHSGLSVPVGFVDPDPVLWGQYVEEVRVHPPSRLQELVEQHQVREIWLALPRIPRRERQEVLRRLELLKVSVRTLPAIEDLALGRVTVSDLRHVGADDLLGREPVPPNAELLARSIRDKTVLVTGAGGSIGTELVRQVLRQRPRRLVMLERGEEQLYEIGQTAQEILAGMAGNGSRPEIVSVLGSILDGPLVERTIAANGVNTVYHAAAFKHVPILEAHPVAAIENNTFGTAILAAVAARCGVERLVLVSTDKAVRPTSVMGASKRLAEMILQARAADGQSTTVFALVRFGNVLDSSGSVMRRFRRQIEMGGPVTVTHPDATRYFMSIPEAAALVIQAGAMATGGDVFVLDMGEPVRIDDLARSMIRLMGLDVRDALHPDGDIAIEYIGLRDGEKLHEELLLGRDILPTEHARIFKCREPWLGTPELARILDQLRAAIAGGSIDALRSELERVPTGLQAAAYGGSPLAATAKAVGNGSDPGADSGLTPSDDPA